MLDLRYARRWQLASATLLLGVLFVAVVPPGWLWPDEPRDAWLANLDKWAHFATFALLTLWFAGQYGRVSYWRIVVGLFAFAVLIEICQDFVGYRTAEALDVGADAAGIAAGLAIALLGAGGWCRNVEAWLDTRGVPQ